ncbi:MAG: ABC transporter ATP-binding protein, partial [Turicibacter sp.]
KYSDRLIIMKNGEIVGDGCPKNVITPAIIEEVYKIECEIDQDPISKKPRIHPIRTLKYT